MVQPTNISVLSHTTIEIKVRHLMMVLSAVPDIEITCTEMCIRDSGMGDEAEMMCARIRGAENYCEALNIIGEYVNIADGSEPVSYTHLDVYKRQHWD